MSIIVPAYRTGNKIYQNLRDIYRVLQLLPYQFELICVVDGSPDTTEAAAKRFAAGKPRVKVLTYPTNRGKGYAVRHGMRHSSGDVIGFMDAGGDISPTGLIVLLLLFLSQRADVVIGSKRHENSVVAYPWQRQVLSMFYQQLVKVLFGLGVRDTQVGMKLFRREVISKVLPKVKVKGYAFDIEILVLAHHLGFRRIFEGPVEVHLDFGGESVVTGRALIKTIATMLKDTFVIFYRLKILHQFAN